MGAQKKNGPTSKFYSICAGHSLLCAVGTVLSWRNCVFAWRSREKNSASHAANYDSVHNFIQTAIYSSKGKATGGRVRRQCVQNRKKATHCSNKFVQLLTPRSVTTDVISSMIIICLLAMCFLCCWSLYGGYGGSSYIYLPVIIIHPRWQSLLLALRIIKLLLPIPHPSS